MSEWAFLVDENLEPQIAEYLTTEGFRAEDVREAPGSGADDQPDVIPYARQNDYIIVTNDVKDFRDVPPSQHEGILVVFDGQRSAFEIAAAITRMTEAYPSRDQFTQDVVDDWL